MKFNLIVLGLLLTSCANTSSKSHHESLLVHQHTHEHGEKCGHKRVQHGDHWDYKHNNEYHHAHKDHVDFHGQTKEGRALASSGPVHKDHDHKHGKDCGHKRVKHGDHWDYLHGNHYHHGSAEHGMP
jgi:hypothetical protein